MKGQKERGGREMEGGREGGRGRRKRVTEEGKGDWYIVPQKVDRQL